MQCNCGADVAKRVIGQLSNMKNEAKIFGVAGYSGSGKTSLIEQVIPRLVRVGLMVSLIKHSHHGFDIDRPGKDSYRHREAGASEVLIASSQRWVVMHELRGEAEPDLPEQIARLSPCDLVLVEGFKRHPIPKLEVHRKQTGNDAGNESDRPLLYPGDPYVVALATNEKLDTQLPQFGLDDYDDVTEFILTYLELQK